MRSKTSDKAAKFYKSQSFKLSKVGFESPILLENFAKEAKRKLTSEFAKVQTTKIDG